MRLGAFARALFLLIFIPSAAFAQQQTPYGPPRTLTTLKDLSITESSGLVASRTTPGAYWTHNDSGDGPFIYSFDTQGRSLGVFRVTGAQAYDWEDMSIGPGPQRGKSYLYLGDIGDNQEKRAEIVVYRVLEPTLAATSKPSTKKRPQATQAAEAITLKYPDGKHDAETLLVHPTTGNIYIVTKVPLLNPVVYEAAPPFNAGKAITMRRIGEIRVPSLFGGVLTGGSVSPDGRRVAFCDYFSGYELVLPASANDFNEIWKQRMTSFDLGKRKQGEGIAYRLDGDAFIATSEGKGSAVIQVERRRPRK
ncbi:MAG TPA: hypothetical protein VFR12_00680 [Pyrinomonadaceae bacterium]|nr:hypothetical protein [Pyrinomonadaceae bacterium]